MQTIFQLRSLIWKIILHNFSIHKRIIYAKLKKIWELNPVFTSRAVCLPDFIFLSLSPSPSLSLSISVFSLTLSLYSPLPSSLSIFSFFNLSPPFFSLSLSLHLATSVRQQTGKTTRLFEFLLHTIHFVTYAFLSISLRMEVVHVIISFNISD